ncbi:response regulator transcription factor [Paenibacillus barcinonensis]|uniref:Response regulator transcription factor n=1 Tax=Paenibacillus barcinonensis TaxID=198119 RepID=A0A2V4VG11_PAEBA|nr:response regulator transcription factor [Paenibacillus barcinonensis]PYE47656.1 two-component system response regulator YesN [Paenibacillus barcinonensis]QKS58528.1 response regulator transcription factor [Paenibacillus barcinonensis]
MINVLIVDDEPFIRQGLLLLIDWNALGFQICGEASNGVQALECIRAVQPDLVISDIKMPEMDGMKLAKVIYEQYGGEMKMVLLSGFYEFEYAKQAIKYQVDDYILKPIVKDELLQVLEAFRDSFLERTEEKRHQEKQEQIVLAQHVQSILLGTADEGTLVHVRAHYGDAAKFRCLMIETESEQEHQQAAWCLQVETAINNTHAGYVLKSFTGEKNRMLHIVTDLLLKQEALSLEQYVTRLYSELSRIQSAAIAIYAGKEVGGLEELHESYYSCSKIKSLRFFSAYGPIYYFEHVDTRVFNNKPAGREKQLFDGLIRAIEEHRTEDVRSHAQAIFQFFLEERIEPGIVGIHLHYLAYTLLGLVNRDDSDLSLDGEWMQSTFLQENYAMLSMEENIENLCEFSYKCAEKLREHQKWNAMGVLARVEAYIHEHYMDNISLKLLGEHFYMNSAYLGQIFKKHYGVSFSDYLNQIRIEEATRLLRRTDYRVYEIAAMVGYRDSDYFINRFEKISGETPAQYRKRAQAMHISDSSSCTP